MVAGDGGGGLNSLSQHFPTQKNNVSLTWMEHLIKEECQTFMRLKKEANASPRPFLTHQQCNRDLKLHQDFFFFDRRLQTDG